MLHCRLHILIYFFQHSLSLRLSISASNEAERVTHKVAWFHPPKTGTSFGATIIHYANSALPKTEGALLLGSYDPFFEKYPYDVWFKNILWKEDRDHAEVTEHTYDEFGGCFAGLFRQPEARLAAMYFTQGPRIEDHSEYLKYAARAAGSMTMQLAGQAQGQKWMLPSDRKEEKPTPDINLAFDRLQKGFMFVGLTEQYDLSVCLFHAMFGGECLEVEFENMRPGPQTLSGAKKDFMATLRGHSDTIDGQLYRAASQLFWKNVKQYKVERSFCLALCPQAKRIFAPESGGEFLREASNSDYKYDWPGRYHLDEDDVESVE